MKRIQFSFAFLLLLSTLIGQFGCSQQESPIEWGIKMANSDMQRNPEAWMIDFRKSPRWGYTNGLMAVALEELSLETGDPKYADYIKNSYYDVLIDSMGIIQGYNMSDYNIDQINSGKALFTIYKNTGDQRYKTAMDTLRSQMASHPRTSDGGFWHKKRYTHQMWLDGIYMGDPFLAQYAKEFNEPELMEDVVHQVLTVQKHTYDSVTGLNYHGYDESREQAWSDSISGKSPHFWGRAQGWYCMALVDILDFLPENHPERDQLIGILKNMFDALQKVKDPQSGMWYQVLTEGNREGNYLEATGSSMFTYAMLKSLRMGYIGDEYKSLATQSFDSLVKTFVVEEEDGTISLSKCCAVSGLGGNPYRDGSFEYYISEPVRDNDPKGVGPFILAAIEMQKLKNNQ